MKIYTKFGDKGKTALIGLKTVSKSHGRVEAYGSLDELNALLGVVVSRKDSLPPTLRADLLEIQSQLFYLGAELATPKKTKKPTAHLAAGTVEFLESAIDEMELSLESLRHFILPGGSETSAFLHLSRTVCRRAERRVVAIAKKEKIRSDVIRYLNRLGDFLFVAARLANLFQKGEETPWISKQN